VEKAIRAITQQWQKMLEKGRISSDTCSAYTGRLRACDSLAQLSACDLVIEAIVEKLAVKKELFAQLEALVPASTVLATNILLVGHGHCRATQAAPAFRGLPLFQSRALDEGGGSGGGFKNQQHGV
jgi:hypothetical protein